MVYHAVSWCIMVYHCLSWCIHNRHHTSGAGASADGVDTSATGEVAENTGARTSNAMLILMLVLLLVPLLVLVLLLVLGAGAGAAKDCMIQ